MEWWYKQPVIIQFGRNSISHLPEIIEEIKARKVMIVSGKHVDASVIQQMRKWFPEQIKGVFTNISPNPDVEQVDECAQLMRDFNIDGVIAIGGGSVLDLAKAAACVAVTDSSIREYHGTMKLLPTNGIPLVAIPTTAGTGSEVTSVSVLTDRKNGKKMPIGANGLYPKYAIVDWELTKTMPAYVTACTGIDVLCHAVEAFWSTGHQPITDALAVDAIKNVFKYLPVAFKNGDDDIAREKMCEASLLAGLAFGIPKTTGSHACSFPLTNLYHIPHGEACALTLDYFLEYNAKFPEARIEQLVNALGMASSSTLGNAIKQLKRQLKLRENLKDLHLAEEQIEELVMLSQHPNLRNNPVYISDDFLKEMYEKLAK